MDARYKIDRFDLESFFGDFTYHFAVYKWQNIGILWKKMDWKIVHLAVTVEECRTWVEKRIAEEDKVAVEASDLPQYFY